ncbi:F-box/LRR-repeat protein 4-like [Saccostrea cucullata]|uniref:F-box/LRR-repeat protein 4-like n=1 Tax=Saccostrea cuccullata TaxID=36930 RepID=UPI002ED1299E
MVVGEPRVYPTYGDVPGAWATSTKDAHQFIEVKFEEKLYLNEINIYETYHAGGVKRVSAKDLAGNWVMLYQTNRCQNLQSSRIFSPQFNPPEFPVDELRVEIDCTVSGSWVELDAINIKGTSMPKFLPGLLLVNTGQQQDVQ